MKNSIDSINNRTNREERISELKGRSFEITQSEEEERTENEKD